MTIRELAKILRLSKSTIAYALSGSPEVSAETRELVQRRARELGYRPNPVASAFLQQIRAQGSERYRANLAFLLPKTGNELFVAYLLKGAHERALELGYGLDDVQPKDYDSARLTRLLLARGVLGVIVGPLPRAVGHMTLDWSKFAVVASGHSMARPAIHRVAHYHAQGIRIAFRNGRRQGLRRIGLALSLDSDQRSSGDWSAGYLGIQRQLPASERVQPLLVPLSKFSTATIRRWIIKERLDAMIIHASGCIPDLSAFLASLPWRVQCIVLDRRPEEPYAGIDQQFKMCGRLLVDSLSSQILHNQRGVPETPILSLVDGVWVDASG